MSAERTLAIVKPDAVGRGLLGEILGAIHQAGLQIVAIQSRRLTKAEAGGFYVVHRSRPFFDDLTTFMSSGKVVAMVLEADNAIGRWRELMGATDPAKAAPGTLRRRFGDNIQNNCVHGSDAAASAEFEIGYFFAGTDLI